MNLIEQMGSMTLFLVEIFRTFFRTHGNRRAISAQVWSVSSRALTTVAFSGVFVGAILVIQFELILAKYDALSLLGGLNTSAVIREVGPLIISCLLAGKIGAFTAAELGTMRVTEQIDAIECLGTNSIQYLILPRFFGILISSLILLLFGLLVSVLGAIGVSEVFFGINPLEYVSSIPKFASLSTLFTGLFKSLIYGGIVATVACHQGYFAKGGATGVGKAVTRASVYTNFLIVLANFVTSQFLESIGRLFQE